MNTMRNTVSKAKVIYSKSDCNWQEAMKLAAEANRTNKTQLIIEACQNGPVSIDDAMKMTGLNKNNLQSRFRKGNSTKVEYDALFDKFRKVVA
mgnify:CR=1 FL=1